MPPKTKKQAQPAPPPVSAGKPGVSRGDGLLPPKVARVGGKAAGRTGTATLKVKPASWASKGTANGRAFTAFMRKQGLDPAQRMSVADLEVLARDFEARPISGHRRGGAHPVRGVSHRANTEHIR